jgi:hypothetical protein
LVIGLSYPNEAQRLSYGKQGRQGNFSFLSAHVAKAFCFVFIFFILKAKSKRFGGLSK